MVIGVYPVIKKWHYGVGIKLPNKPTISLFIYPGYLNVEVLAAITVEIKELVSWMLALEIPNLSSAIQFKAVLSRTIVQSEFNDNLFSVNKELYG